MDADLELKKAQQALLSIANQKFQALISDLNYAREITPEPNKVIPSIAELYGIWLGGINDSLKTMLENFTRGWNKKGE